MKSTTPQHANIITSLRHEARFVVDQAKRATILRDCLLSRFLASDDLPPCTVQGESNRLHLDQLKDRRAVQKT